MNLLTDNLKFHTNKSKSKYLGSLFFQLFEKYLCTNFRMVNGTYLFRTVQISKFKATKQTKVIHKTSKNNIE